MFQILSKAIPFIICLLLFLIVAIGLSNSEFMKIIFEQLSTLINVLISVAVGFYAAPFIKKSESDVIKKENKEKLSIELSDIRILSNEKIDKLIDSTKEYPYYYSGRINNISGIAKIEINFIEKMYAEHFIQLTYNQRKLVKATTSIIKLINELFSTLEADFKCKDIKIHTINITIYHLCLLFWLTNSWEQQKNYSDFTFNNKTDDERVKDVLAALNITTTLEPLLKT